MAATIAAKNAFQSPTLTDLGLGDQLHQQLMDELEKRKGKGVLAAGQAPGGDQQLAQNGLTAKYLGTSSPLLNSLFGGMK